MFEMIAKPARLLVRLETLRMLTDIDTAVFLGDVGVRIGFRQCLAVLC